MRDLNGMIPSGTGWTLLAAHAISDDGKIVGYGSKGGQTRAFLLLPTPNGSVSGQVFHDADGNGSRGPGEAALFVLARLHRRRQGRRVRHRRSQRDDGCERPLGHQEPAGGHVQRARRGQIRLETDGPRGRILLDRRFNRRCRHGQELRPEEWLIARPRRSTKRLTPVLKLDDASRDSGRGLKVTASWLGGSISIPESGEGPHGADLRRLSVLRIAPGLPRRLVAEIVHLAVVAVLAEAGVGDAGDRVLADRLDALERRAELMVGEPAEDGGFDGAVEVAGLLGGHVLEVAGRVVARRAAARVRIDLISSHACRSACGSPATR